MFSLLCSIKWSRIYFRRWVKNFEKNGTNLLGHPVINKNLGIEFSNGSLGMGLSLGVGVCLGLKKKWPIKFMWS